MLQESPESSQSGRIAFFKIFLWGAMVTSVLVGLIFLYVPASPKGQQKTVSISQYESAPAAPAESAQPTSDSGSGQGSTASGGESGTPAAQTSRSAESVYQTYCAQ